MYFGSARIHRPSKVKPRHGFKVLFIKIIAFVKHLTTQNRRDHCFSLKTCFYTMFYQAIRLNGSCSDIPDKYTNKEMLQIQNQVMFQKRTF